MSCFPPGIFTSSWPLQEVQNPAKAVAMEEPSRTSGACHSAIGVKIEVQSYGGCQGLEGPRS